MSLPKLSRKALIGIIFIYIAGIGWGAEFIIPFTSLPNKAIIFTVVLVIAELSFLVGVALLGKAYYKELKAKLLSLITKPQSGQAPPGTPNEESRDKNRTP